MNPKQLMSITSKPTLDEILAAVRSDLAMRRREKTMRQQMVLAGRRKDYRDFGLVIRKSGNQRMHWIGEVKKASPSAGLIKADFDPVAIAQIYAQHGATAVSVLTEGTFFQGSLNDLARVHADIALPALRKDFIVDEYQIVEAAACGADAILLIVAILDFKTLERFQKAAADNNLACLVEVHASDELDKALDAGALVIGINNRNLKTLEVDLDVTERLYPQVPKGMIVITESGYKTRAEIQKAQAMGIDAVLIGETLMRSADTGKAADELFGNIS